MTITREEALVTLTHHGTKGMKWGVRQDKGHEGEAVKTSKLDKLDSKWQKSIYTTKGAIAVHNAVADKMNNGEIEKFNSQSKYKGKNLNEDSALMHDYNSDFEKLSDRLYTQAVHDVHGVSPSGKKFAVYVHDANGPRIIISERDQTVHHADNATEPVDPDLVLRLKLDPTGHILEMNKAASALAHGEEFATEVLEHHGTKGMKWGVRRAAGAAAGAAKSAGRSIAENDRQIEAARAARPQMRSSYKTAKKQYRADKKVVGRSEAKKILAPVKSKYYKNLWRSMDETSSEKAARVVSDLLNSYGKTRVHSFR